MGYELSLVDMHMCASIDGPLSCDVKGSNGQSYHVTGLYHERSYPECTCPAFKYGKRTVQFGPQKYPKPCKHIAQAEQQLNPCGWHEQYDGGYNNDGRCPRCGGPVVHIRCAV